MALNSNFQSFSEVLELQQSLNSRALELAYVNCTRKCADITHDEDARQLRLRLILLEDENDDLHEQLAQENARTVVLERQLEEARTVVLERQLEEARTAARAKQREDARMEALKLSATIPTTKPEEPERMSRNPTKQSTTIISTKIDEPERMSRKATKQSTTIISTKIDEPERTKKKRKILGGGRNKTLFDEEEGEPTWLIGKSFLGGAKGAPPSFSPLKKDKKAAAGR